ncbi:SRPBCC family protein [Brevibacillus choshinensis]|uniref:hypothetical protein n=1 Tax=Brevibacillus choshinensis TaxID=54911 RepID=UPI0006EC2E07|nr:hypothetical protein [Brevibacillus choshinensis]
MLAVLQKTKDGYVARFETLNWSINGEDRVRFELYSESDGCRLVLFEKINKMTGDTPKDLAGWHVCLDVIKALLDDRIVDSREKEWEKWYKEYSLLVENFDYS